MQTIPTTNRILQVYLNYGVISFLFMFTILQMTDEFFMWIFPLVFNGLLYNKFKHTEIKNNIRLIALFSWLLTFFIFYIQYKYYHFIDWGCMRFIPKVTVNSSYVYTMLLFSMLSWEIGFLMKRHQKR
jgi:hypothetical protein